MTLVIAMFSRDKIGDDVTLLNFEEYYDFSNSIFHIDTEEEQKNYSSDLMVPGPYVGNKDVLRILGSNKKALIGMAENFFHYINDFLGSLLVFIKEAPDEIKQECTVIIDATHHRINKEFYFDFLNDILTRNNIKHQIITDKSLQVLETNNFTVLSGTPMISTIGEVYKAAVEYTQTQDVVPYKKVYISRTLKSPDMEKRVDSEELLEAFFIECGYEVIDTASFSNLYDQIKYFRDVKTIAGLTGAGMTNMMFMSPKQKVIEIATPIRLGGNPATKRMPDLYEMHHFYRSAAAVKDHFLASIPNMRGSSSDVISYLDQYRSIL
jgi:hypothetical protein